MVFQSEEAVLTDLSVDRNYEISVSAVNSQGAGPSGTPAVVWVGEAVPTAPPAEVAAEPLSPTEVALSWRPPSLAHQNGDLLGYKVTIIATNCVSPKLCLPRRRQMSLLSHCGLELSTLRLNRRSAYLAHTANGTIKLYEEYNGR